MKDRPLRAFASVWFVNFAAIGLSATFVPLWCLSLGLAAVLISVLLLFLNSGAILPLAEASVVEVAFLWFPGPWFERLSLHGWLLLAAGTSVLRFAAMAAFGQATWLLVLTQVSHVLTFAALQPVACRRGLSHRFNISSQFPAGPPGGSLHCRNFAKRQAASHCAACPPR